MIREGHRVLGIDSFSDYYSADVKVSNILGLESEKRFRLVRGDLLTANLAELLDGVDYIFHQAGQPGVRESWGKSFDVYLKTNVLATQLLLEAAKDQPIKKFVYASSSSIYGEAESFPISEETVPHPESPYGVTKLAGEQLCYLYWRNHGVPTVSLRYFTVYGPRQRPDMAFHKFIRAIFEGSEVTIYGDGAQTRDFTYVEDAVSANVLACQSELAGEVMNIGGGSQITLRKAIEVLERVVGKRAKLRFEASKHGDARNTAADISRARTLLGYDPSVGLEKGLSKEVEYCRLNDGW